MPKISIILPTYNVEKYIARALDSCINQTLQDIEIIVVDDKGQDKSIDIAKEYAIKDNRIKIIHNKENIKTLLAKAEGVKAANSDIIMFLDPDDELELNACEIVYSNFNDNTEVVRFDYQYIGFDDNYGLRLPNDYNDFIVKTKKFEYFDLVMCNMSCKKDLYLKCFVYIEEYGLKEVNIIDDVIFVFLINNNITNFIMLKDKLYKYYKNENSIMTTKTEQARKLEIKTLNKALDFFNYLAIKYPEKFYNCLYITHFITIGHLVFTRKKEFLKYKYKNNFIKYAYFYCLFKLEKNSFIKCKKKILRDFKCQRYQ